MRILIFGSTGMLGHTLIRYLMNQNLVDVEFTVRNNSKQELCKKVFKKEAKYYVDAENPHSALKAIKDFHPDYCINCLGLIKQKKESRNYVKAIQINSLIPHLLSDYCMENDSQLIHISTDCVFSGKKGNYLDSDSPDPQDLYGRSKLLGEVSNKNALTIRTSIIGPEINSANGLFEWFKSSEKSIYGYKEAFFSGLPTIELSKIIFQFLIKRKIKNDIYNLSSNPISKFDLLNLINEVYDFNKDIIADDSFKIDRTLNCERFIENTGFVKSEWKDMLVRMRDFG